MKDPAFYGKKAGAVLAIIAPEILTRFQALKEAGLAEEIWIFGSVANGRDSLYSDIDIMLQVSRASFRMMGLIEEKLCEWVNFPIHILLLDGANYIPEVIYKERIRLCDWIRTAPRNFSAQSSEN